MDASNRRAAPCANPRWITHGEHGHRAIAGPHAQNHGIRASGATHGQRMPGELERTHEVGKRHRAITRERARAAQGDRTSTENRRNLKHDHDPK